jgi:hypothetical protein
VAPGQLGSIKAILPVNQLSSGKLLPRQRSSTDTILLLQLFDAAGPVISVPAVTNTVSLVVVTGRVYDVDVLYFPIRIGWATTVQATQGLEFDRVCLDLNSAAWLDSGGYSGVGHVRGDLRQCLRIWGGFSGNREVFRANPAAIRWYTEVVMPACR